ncbi:autotransporter domain-containing protein [Candidatus Pelagibacter sp.]|nr:autotransporter domain-containing protein [Candidatus Pelagibacter sp.]
MKFFLLAIIFLISFLNNFAFGEIPQSNKIIAYYSFSGNANDSSGNDYNGTISGNPQLTTDRFGNSNSAYSFDGNGDWIYFGTDTLPTNNGGNISDAYTISVWAKSSSNSTMDLFAYGGMVSCGGGRYGAIVRLGSNIQFNSCNNGFNTSASGKNSDGNWHHYVVTWNGSNSRKVYIDGSLVSSNSTSNVFRIQNTGLVIGRGFMDWTLGTTFNGSADEMRLWNTELSSSEVQTLYDDESTSAPTLSSSVPTDNATSIAVDSTIILNFSSNVDTESGNITIKKTSDNSTVETIDVTSGQVTGSNSSQITITPSSNFDSLTEYYVLIDATSFDDSSSNSYAGISSTTDLSFTTVNAVPTLSSSVPADDATGVSIDANIVLNFSESVDAESGNITIKKTSDNSTVETIDVTSGQVTGSGTSQITINPLSNFDAETEYYVLIDAAAFDDSDSGSYAGISSTTALSFTTAEDATVDPTTDKNVIGLLDVQVNIVKNTFTQSVSVVSNRLSYLRQNKGNDNLSKNNIKLDFGNALLTSLTETVQIGNASSGKLIPDDWSSWSEGTISITKIGDTSNSSSKEIDSQGIAVGFDKKLNDNDLLGFAVQYGQSDTDIGTSGSGIDTKNYNISIYRTKPLDDNNFIEGTIGVGQIKSDLVRKNGSNTLTGSRDGNQIFGSINYGKTFSKKDFSLTPIGRIDLGYTELDAYTEIGTDALSYDKQNVESGLASLGLEINDIIKFNQSNLKPFGKVEYGLDFSNSSDAKMHYVSDTSTTYTYTQGVNSTHLLSGEIGFNFVSKENLLITTSYKRIQGSESEHSDTIKFGVNFISKRETEYAMTLDGSDEMAAGFNVVKNINGFDLSLNAKQAFNENADQAANVSLSKSF